MRPRVFPAEDTVGNLFGATAELASMRPRVFPAEDSSAGHMTVPPYGRLLQ